MFYKAHRGNSLLLGFSQVFASIKLIVSNLNSLLNCKHKHFVRRKSRILKQLSSDRNISKDTLSTQSRDWNPVLIKHSFKWKAIYVFIPTLPLPFSTRICFKGHISLSQRPINSLYLTHLWAHFSRLLPLAVLTSITFYCHSSLILMSSW